MLLTNQNRFTDTVCNQCSVARCIIREQRLKHFIQLSSCELGDIQLLAIQILSNIPQTQLAHNYLLSYAAVNGKDTDMLTDGESEGALAYVQPIKNDKGFDLPQTGDNSVWMYGAIGITMMAGALVVILLASKKNKKNQSAQ